MDGKLAQALEDLESFDIRVHLELFIARRVVELPRRYHLRGYDALYFDLARTLGMPLPLSIAATVGRPKFTV